MLALRCDLRISASIQVVEISSLTEHLLTECDRRDSFGKCYRCSEAVLKEELPRHLKTKDCNREPRPWVPQGLGCGVGVGGQTSRPPAPLLFCPRSCVTGVTRSCLNEIISAAKPEKLANRCPLCHENFSPGEEVRGPGWGVPSRLLSVPDQPQGSGCWGGGRLHGCSVRNCSTSHPPLLPEPLNVSEALWGEAQRVLFFLLLASFSLLGP